MYLCWKVFLRGTFSELQVNHGAFVVYYRQLPAKRAGAGDPLGTRGAEFPLNSLALLLSPDLRDPVIPVLQLSC